MRGLGVRHVVIFFLSFIFCIPRGYGGGVCNVCEGDRAGRNGGRGGGAGVHQKKRMKRGERRMDLGNSPTRRKVDSPNIPAQEASQPDPGM